MYVRRGRKQRQSRDSAPRALAIERLEGRAMLAVGVVPSVETVNTSGADDIAVWIHPTDPSQSTIIGAIKTSNSALRVYDLAGNQLQSVSSGMVNNVDLRYNFSLSGQPTTLVTGSNRSNDSIVIYRVNPQTRLLESIAARTISTGVAIYGLGMYVSPATGKYYTFVTSESGQVQQWELFDNGAGLVDAAQVRSFSVGSQSEGIVADDVHGSLYVGEEDDGIWKYSAEPNGGTARTSVDSTGGGGHLVADVEGLSIYYKPDGTGYLLASSQGNSEFAVYRREGANVYLGNFELIAGGSIDAVSDTDGIDVTNFPLGSQFPQGMFVAQDNDVNFKLVRWDSITSAFAGLLSSDTSWDPRLVGAPQPSATIVARHLFYNQSSFDGNSAAIGPADDAAIAPDKAAYRAGDGLAAASAVSSYSHGVNGILIDLAELPPGTVLTANDFQFKIGNNNAPGSWIDAPPPTAISLRPGAGEEGSDRVAVTWDAGAIRNAWLQVTVEGNDAAGGFNANTSLPTSDVFYWGSRVGDSFISSAADAFATSTTDSLQVFASLGAGKPITEPRDYNRDGRVSTTDSLMVFGNLGSIVRLNLAGEAFASEATSDPDIAVALTRLREPVAQSESFGKSDRHHSASETLAEIRANAIAYWAVQSGRPSEREHAAADAIDDLTEELLTLLTRRRRVVVVG